MKDRGTALLTVAVFGYAFLYIPLISVIFYSFNDSRLVTLWGGFSLRWYRVLFESEEIWSAALLSFRIAAISATVAMILGTLVGLALNRLGSFRGRLLLTGMITAPLVMPEIITGISLLFLFITLADWIGWPGSTWWVGLSPATAPPTKEPERFGRCTSCSNAGASFTVHPPAHPCRATTTSEAAATRKGFDS